MHTLIFLIKYYDSYSMATPGDPKALLFKNHIYVVALAPDL